MTPDTPARARSRRGWTALAIVLALFVVLAGVDAVLKRAPHAGFVLPDAELTVTASDFPRAWSSLEDSAAFQRMRGQAPQTYQQIGLASRHRTGVRWTPLRWYVWFGRPLAVSRTADGWAMSCKPGLLVRAARAVGALDHAAWRDGFLILGSNPESAEALARDGVAVQESVESGSLALAWDAKPAGNITFTWHDDWSLRGSVSVSDGDAVATAAPRRLDHWPDAPVATLFVSQLALVNALLPESWPEFPFSSELRASWDAFREQLPRDWDAGAGSYQFALQAVETRGAVPVPELGVVLRADAPFPPLTAPPAAIPYVWGVTRGWMQPWHGEPLSLYAASDPRVRAFTNQEPAMSRLLDAPLDGRAVSHDVRLDADLAQLATIAKAIARKAAEQQLLPAYDVRDVDRDISPLISALGELGRVTVEGNVEDGRLRFTGSFTAPLEPDGGGDT